MSHGFESDANYFEFLANQQRDIGVRKERTSIAETYRHLCKNGDGLLAGTREERWRKRAEECRTLSEGHQDEFCRAKLLRRAEAYRAISQFVLYSSPPRATAVNSIRQPPSKISDRSSQHADKRKSYDDIRLAGLAIRAR